MEMRSRYAVLDLLLGLTVVVGAILLALEPLFGDAAERLLIAILTLAAAGLLVHRLGSGRDRLVAELSERAMTDGLTGLLNRAALEERAALELARARRAGTSMSLLVLDVDGFKALNDSHGHPAGDALLRAIAAGLREHTRQIDGLARLGGDEFVILLPGASADEALLVAERLGQLAESASLAAGFSVGIAATDSGAESFDDLWRAADAAMYEAKRAGGDAVRLASA